MKRAATSLAAVALIPFMAGQLDGTFANDNVDAGFVVALCNGGTISIPLSNGSQEPEPRKRSGCAKICHASEKRRRLDQTQ